MIEVGFCDVEEDETLEDPPDLSNPPDLSDPPDTPDGVEKDSTEDDSKMEEVD